MLILLFATTTKGLEQIAAQTRSAVLIVYFDGGNDVGGTLLMKASGCFTAEFFRFVASFSTSILSRAASTFLILFFRCIKIKASRVRSIAVSYTHLTLPTKA